ncbi:acetylornithine carbamoyltransferase [soil metagenome]
MKKFTSVHDVANVEEILNEAIALKTYPGKFLSIGKNKTLGIIFLNPSLRTRLSTQKAAMNLGMNVMVVNVNQESWAWEFEDGAVMDGKNVEHIKDAASVIGMYCDVVAIRCFASLQNREEDYSEKMLNRFIKYCAVPVISLESATLHPLQSFADLITIKENFKQKRKPKVVLTWAPHIKPLPQAVANSFSEWMNKADVDFTIVQPRGYELSETFSGNAKICFDQDEAIRNADFVYVKNWSSFQDYGKMPEVNSADWILTEEKMQLTNNGKIMHCLPVRRNVELCDELLDGKNSLVKLQAENRVFAAQVVLKKILETNAFQKQNQYEEAEIIHH